MSERKSNLELAQAFYDFHKLLFRQAENTADTADRWFEFTAEQFDDWAVAAGLMVKAARDTEGLEHGGALHQRHDLRIRLNRAARKGEGLGRAFSIEARGGKWRIVLRERYVVEQPNTIVSGIRQCLERSDRMVDLVNRMAAQEELTDEERLLVKMRLEMAQMSIFNGLQLIELVIASFRSDKPLDLKRLRRRMSRLLISEKAGRKSA